MKRPRLTGVSLLACLITLACGAPAADPFSAEAAAERAERFPLLGLYTPGNTIGYEPPRVGSVLADGGVGLNEAELRAVEASIQEATTMDRCLLPDAAEGSAGSLSFSFQSATYHGFYEPENCGAVWIEDAEGRYVATPLVWAGVRLRNLFVWDARRCRADTPDAVSSATLPDHSMTHEGQWDGRDHMGRVAPDGSYVLNIEITEDEFNYGRRVQVPFDKGPEALTLMPDDSESVLDLKLSFAPGAAEAANP
ncbi:MAG: DUF2271 domain-containing protein [Myxococcales bacterium]|nr:DUF2271 domain-containing protein [Myxococcales bacterium]